MGDASEPDGTESERGEGGAPTRPEATRRRPPHMSTTARLFAGRVRRSTAELVREIRASGRGGGFR